LFTSRFISGLFLLEYIKRSKHRIWRHLRTWLSKLGLSVGVGLFQLGVHNVIVSSISSSVSNSRLFINSITKSYHDDIRLFIAQQ